LLGRSGAEGWLSHWIISGRKLPLIHKTYAVDRIESRMCRIEG
jgi:hypothetical protein